MKTMVAALSVLLFTNLALAQNRPPAPSGGPQDTILQKKNASDREAGPMCPHQKGFNSHEWGHKFGPDARGPEMMSPDRNGPDWRNARFDKTEKRYCYPGKHPPPPPFFFAHAILFLLLVGCIVNLLLTVIVSLDMARNGRFNGLWIPVLLLVGIPGAAIYALFRIGDKMQCK